MLGLWRPGCYLVGFAHAMRHPSVTERLANLLRRGIHGGWIRSIHRHCLLKVIIAHRRGGEEVNMGMRNIKASNDIAGALAIKGSLNSLAMVKLTLLR